MRPREDELIDPEIAEQLDAIDATLAGDPVDPRFAEIAELALLLSAGRPEGPRPEFARELDLKVQARFRGGSPAAAAAASARALAGGGRAVRRWRLMPALGAGGTALAAVVAAIVVVTAGSGPRTVVENSALLPRSAASKAASAASGAGGSASAGSTKHQAVTPAAAGSTNARLGSVRVPAAAAAPSHGRSTGTFFGPGAPSRPVVNKTRAQTIYGSPSTIAAPAAPVTAAVAPVTAPTTTTPSVVNGALVPAPIPNGRRIVQSSMIQLGAPARRIDAVAQEVFYVVSAVSGIVDSSHVASTGGLGAAGQFQLRIPSASLPTALSELSHLRYANVLARIDNTQDINSAFVTAGRQIADAKAARAALLKRLAAAPTESEILSLRAQITQQEAIIARAQASLRTLNRRVDYSRVDVTLQATNAPPPPSSSGGGFGLRQAGHDAIRVLEVSAGVALIALAVIVPVGLLAALGWWVGAALQRRRRERALDLA